MTIAAGFVVRDGLLLCADTLYTDGFTKEYRDKIFPWTGGGAIVCFALAGSDAVGRMAIDDCRDALSSLTQKRLTLSNILQTVRPIVKWIQEQYVDTRPHEERDVARFHLLMAIATAGGSRLYATTHGAIAHIDTFDCVGAGEQLGRYLIQPMYRQDLTIDEAAVLAVQALAAAKEIVDGVGGRSQFVAIRNNRLSTVFPYDVNNSEPLILEYRRYVDHLLFAMADRQLDNQDFLERLRTFERRVQQLQKSWTTEVSWEKLANWIKDQ